MEYFNGQKELSSESISTGKSSFIKYLIYEEWTPIIEESLRCGAESSSKITKKIGVSKKEVLNLESSVTSSLGNNVFFKIESALKGNIGTENLWSEEVTNERTISFKAPECGYLKIEQHQLKRTIKITTIKRRLLRKTIIKNYSIRELLNKFYDNSLQEIDDRSCNCKEPTEKTMDGYLVGTTGNITFNIPYVYTKKGVSLNLGSRSFILEKWDLSNESIIVETSALSDSLQYLIDKENEEINIDISQNKLGKNYSLGSGQTQGILFSGYPFNSPVFSFLLTYKLFRDILSFFIGIESVSSISSVEKDKHKDD